MSSARRRQKSVTLVIVDTPRKELGWPCFYCAAPLAKCKTAAHGFGRCCKRCRGKGSH